MKSWKVKIAKLQQYIYKIKNITKDYLVWLKTFSQDDGELYNKHFYDKEIGIVEGMTLEQLEWLEIWLQASVNNNIIGTWLSFLVGALIPILINTGLSLAQNALNLVDGNIVYIDFIRVIIIGGAITALLLGVYFLFIKSIGKAAILFFAIFWLTIFGISYFTQSDYYILGNFYFLVLMSSAITLFVATCASIKQQKNIIRLELVKKQLKKSMKRSD